MHLIKEYQESINQGLNNIQYPKHPERLYEPIRYFMSIGGKRIRPVLTLLAAEMHDCPIEKSLNAALAIELFHNFTLLHDDIMDHASLRRGEPTVHEKWNSSIAILSGDTMLISAYQLLTQNDPAVLPQLLNTFNTVAIEVCQGQQLDMDYEEKSSISVDEYLNMIRLKTAVLLGAALKIGGIVSGAPEDSIHHLEQFGINLGIAFQLQDDLLDVYGDVNEFGKKIGGDIIANKKTFLMVKAMELAEGDHEVLLQKWIHMDDSTGDQATCFDETIMSSLNSQAKRNKPLMIASSPLKTNYSDEKIKNITRIYNDLGIRELTMEKMAFYSEKAYDELNRIDLPSHKKETLKQLTESLLVRSS